MASSTPSVITTHTIRLHGLRGDAACLFIADLDRPVVWVTSKETKLESLCRRVASLAPQKRVYPLPPLMGNPYAHTPQHESISHARITCLAGIKRGDWDVIITSAKALLQKLPPRQFLLTPSHTIAPGQTRDLSSLLDDLIHMGYRRVELVGQEGEFACRGGIVDIFPLTQPTPIRIEFFDDDVEELRRFDPSSQRSSEPVDQLEILPHGEWCVGQEAKRCFSQQGKAVWNKTRARNHFVALVDQLNQTGRFPGHEHWLPLFFSQTTTLATHIPDPAIFFFDDGSTIQDELNEFLVKMSLQQEEARKSARLFASNDVLFHVPSPDNPLIPDRHDVMVHDVLAMETAHRVFETKSVPKYHGRFAQFLSDYAPQSRQLAIILVCPNSKSQDKLATLLTEHGHSFRYHSFPLTKNPEPGFYVATGVIENGFVWENRHLMIVGEADLWDTYPIDRRIKPNQRIFESDFRDLKVGDRVIHEDHGVGEFLGLLDMQAGGRTHEMMALAYRDGNRLYVSLNQLHKIQRFSAQDADVHLDKLGGVSWSKKRQKARKSVKRLAVDLLRLQAERRMATPLRCGPDTPWQREFEDQFAYELTPDQARTLDEIKRSLEESEQPMDRLLVGDVGFGKTEVAMRIAFKMVMEGGQVAVLCPTTVLAFQHYLTFQERFGRFPVSVHWLSRFSKGAERRDVLSGLANGSVDVIIGTHRLLSSDVRFKNLACLIVDEEQRFGVGHKERLKVAKKRIHVLSMSATPIPRSMYMAFSGLRDMSIIQTPPRNRLSICTSVMIYRDHLVKAAIEFELNRGGQVYFVHNRVETMNHVASALATLVPNARIDMAHGQMDSRRLERIMLRFIRHESDVLVASTIIENGLDIANANTMIINRADEFGMSQLYQLRGRIGRSEKPAFAYLMVPPRKSLNPQARKRLAALEEFSDLGSGFRIAALDMEIRGSGNLLGPEQAGHIQAVGLDLYLRMLRQSVAELRGQAEAVTQECTLTLKTEAALPRSYMSATNQRIHYYRRISSADTTAEVADIAAELVDCYGPLPQETAALLSEAELRIDLTRCGVLSVERKGSRLFIRLSQATESVDEITLDDSGLRALPDNVLALELGRIRDSAQVVQAIRRMLPRLFPEAKPISPL